MLRFFSQRRPSVFESHRGGSIVVLAAVLMTVVFAMAAFALDLGYIEYARMQLQNTADAAALAGAQALIDGTDAAVTAAGAVGAQNKVNGQAITISSSDDVELGRWDKNSSSFTKLSGTSTSDSNAVRVTCKLSKARGNSLNLFFAPVLGTKSADVQASAIALAASTSCGKIIGLDFVTMSASSHTDSYRSSQGYNVNTAGSQGHVCTNGDITMSGSATIHGDGHPGKGKTVKMSGTANVTGNKTPLSQTLVYPAVDPGDAATINDNYTIPLSTYNKNPVNSKKEFTLSGGDSVTLSPGTYYFAKFTLSGGSYVTVTGETKIYCTGDFTISGSSIANTTALPKNLQIYPTGSKCDISGSSNLYAVVYGPTTDIIRSGSSDYFGMMVGQSLTLSGEGGIHADDDLTFLKATGSSKAKLVK